VPGAFSYPLLSLFLGRRRTRLSRLGGALGRGSWNLSIRIAAAFGRWFGGRHVMNVQDYLRASDEQRSLILSQAEIRLGDQHAFAQAADARAATVTSAAAALSTAGVGAFAAALSTGINWPLAAGAAVAAVGFGMSARLSLKSARCVKFHPKGYRPCDFADDIRLGKEMKTTQAEMAEDLNERIQFNPDILAERGDLIGGSMELLWKTPVAAAAAAAVAAVVGSAPAIQRMFGA